MHGVPSSELGFAHALVHALLHHVLLRRAEWLHAPRGLGREVILERARRERALRSLLGVLVRHFLRQEQIFVARVLLGVRQDGASLEERAPLRVQNRVRRGLGVDSFVTTRVVRCASRRGIEVGAERVFSGGVGRRVLEPSGHGSWHRFLDVRNERRVVVIIIPDLTPVPSASALVPAPPLGRRGTAFSRHPRADRAPPSGQAFLGVAVGKNESVGCVHEKQFTTSPQEKAFRLSCAFLSPFFFERAH